MIENTDVFDQEGEIFCMIEMVEMVTGIDIFLVEMDSDRNFGLEMDFSLLLSFFYKGVTEISGNLITHYFVLVANTLQPQ